MIHKMLLRFAAYLVFGFIGLSLYCFFLYTHPRRTVAALTPEDFGLAYEEITLKTRDGLSLDAWFIPRRESRKSIVICHGYPMDKGNILPDTSFLAADYNLLLFDFRAMGKSAGRLSTGGWREQRDFLAAVAFLKEKGFTEIGAFGFSMGAAVVLMAANTDVRCIVSDSSFADLTAVLGIIFRDFGIARHPLIWLVKVWARLFLGIDISRVSPERSIAGSSIPILLIHSEKDSQIPVEQAYRLHQACPASVLWIVPEADHGRQMAESEQEYQDRIRDFFRKNL